MINENELKACVAQIQAGDAAAMEELYLAYAEAMRRYCYARLNDAEATQDCVQEIFMCAWHGLKRFEYRGAVSFAAWLYAIANNMVISFVRQRQRRPQLSLNTRLQLSDPRDTARTVADKMALQQAVHQLTPEQQLVITLRFFACLTLDEVAATMHRSVGAVKALQHRAMKRLEQMLADDDTEPHLAPAPECAPHA